VGVSVPYPAEVPTLDNEWRRIHLRTPRPAAPRWLAPAAAGALVVTAVGIWGQLPARHAPRSQAAEAPAPTATGAPAPQLAVSHAGGVIDAAGAQWQVGRADDQVVEGDWDCDGRATLALLRPATGDVYRFDAWSSADADLRGTPIGRVPGARALRAGDLDADRCDELLAEGADGTTTVLTTR
jgi:hypothetical protein